MATHDNDLMEIADEQEARISDLEQEREALRRRIAELGGEVDAAQAWAAKLQTANKRLRDAADELVDTIAALVRKAAQ